MSKTTDQNKQNRFLSIEEAILGLKRPLKVYSLAVVTINIFILILGLFIQIKEEEPVQYSTFETCLYGMQQIIENNPAENLVNAKVIKDLSDVQMKVDYIHLVKVVNSFTCDVFTKDPNGVKRYLVSLEKNSKFPHKFRILDVKGQKVDSRYQL